MPWLPSRAPSPPPALSSPQSRHLGSVHPSARIRLPALHLLHWVVVKPGGHPASGSCSQGLQAQGTPYRGLELLSWVGWSQPGPGSWPPPWQAAPAQGQGCRQRGHRAGQGVPDAAAPGLAPGWVGQPPWWPEGVGIPVQPGARVPRTSPLPAATLVQVGPLLLTGAQGDNLGTGDGSPHRPFELKRCPDHLPAPKNQAFLAPLELLVPLAPLELLVPLAPLELLVPLAPLELLAPLAPLELLAPLAPLELLVPLAPLELLEPLDLAGTIPPPCWTHPSGQPPQHPQPQLQMQPQPQRPQRLQ